jgi:hypothetical protein
VRCMVAAAARCRSTFCAAAPVGPWQEKGAYRQAWIWRAGVLGGVALAPCWACGSKAWRAQLGAAALHGCTHEHGGGQATGPLNWSSSYSHPHQCTQGRRAPCHPSVWRVPRKLGGLGVQEHRRRPPCPARHTGHRAAWGRRAAHPAAVSRKCLACERGACWGPWPCSIAHQHTSGWGGMHHNCHPGRSAHWQKWVKVWVSVGRTSGVARHRASSPAWLAWLWKMAPCLEVCPALSVNSRSGNSIIQSFHVHSW